MRSKREKSFTLIELLVVIAVISLLSSIVLVALKGGREKAQTAKTLQWARSIQAQLGGDRVGSWNFNEGQGTTTLDASGYNNGILYSGTTICSNPPTAGCPTWTDGVQGLTGRALRFDGTDDYINAGNGLGLNITNAITIETWTYNMRNYGGASYDQLFGKGMDSAYAVYWRQSNGVVTFRMYLGGIQRNLDATEKMDVNVWKHWVFSYDGSSMRIYVNGELDNVALYNGSIGVSNLYFGIGKDPSRSYYFNGTIDEVRVYSRALTATEVEKHYAEGLPRHLAEKSIYLDMRRPTD